MASFEQDPTDPTGIKDLTPNGNQDVTRARIRKAHEALDLLIAGWSWDDIAQVAGYPSGRHAQVAVETALESEVLTETSQKHVRKLFMRRYERLLRAFWVDAIDTTSPDRYAAAKTVLAIMADARKLGGLDAPQQYVVTSPSNSDIEQWVSAVIAREQPALEEADIFADEPIPGEVVHQGA